MTIYVPISAAVSTKDEFSIVAGVVIRYLASQCRPRMSTRSCKCYGGSILGVLVDVLEL